MTPAEFQAQFTPYAQTVATGTGLQPGLFLAQWSVETACGSAIYNYNLGNIETGQVTPRFASYGSYAQFCNAQIILLHWSPYSGVLASAGKTLGEQCVALGASPWDAGHYNNGGGPGSSLIAQLPAFGMDPNQLGDTLTQAEFDALVAANPQLGALGYAARIAYGLGMDYHPGQPNLDTSSVLTAVLAAIAKLPQAPPSPTDLSALISAVQANTAQLAAQTTELNAIKAELDAVAAKVNRDLA